MNATEPTPLTSMAPDACICGMPEFCVCPPTERALRRTSSQTGVRFSAAQREWCLAEIDLVEGYSRKDYETADDCEIAGGVLNAWTDYCRDKGML